MKKLNFCNINLTPNKRGIFFLRSKEKHHRSLGRFDLAVAFQECADWLEANPDSNILNIPEHMFLRSQSGPL